jgi:hypothetical protein
MYICVNINQTNYTMKKLNYLFALVALFAFTACGSSSEKAAEEAVVEETVVEEAVVEDTTAAEEVVEEATEEEAAE